MIVRALIIVCALVRIAAADFDHMVHDRTIAVAGGTSIACVKCHAERGGRLVGRPDHATCFGACHGSAPVAPKSKQAVPVPAEKQKICLACHTDAALAKPFDRTVPVPYPPYVKDRDFTVLLGHKQHRGFACTQCHTDFGAKQGTKTPHARCSGCHDGGKDHGAAMTKCESCHQRAVGAPQPTALATATLPIGSTFSHAKHANRSAAGKACATCHAPVSATDDAELPRPDAKTCAIAGCHDAKGAFSIVTACTKCHVDPPSRSFKIERPTARFLHSKHATAPAACATCHRLVATGDVVPGSHEACATSGCHADDFGLRKPTICGACHNTTEPWRALVPDRAPADATEFGASLDHGKHATIACASCHRLRTTTRELRPQRGHTSCATAGCHAVKGGPAPQFGNCEGCHKVGLVATREKDRLGAKWSVRGRFAHTSTHQFGKDGAPLACTACHDNLTSVTVLSLAAPTKQSCAPCHEGNIAFKLTGTGCARCHGNQAR